MNDNIIDRNIQIDSTSKQVQKLTTEELNAIENMNSKYKELIYNLGFAQLTIENAEITKQSILKNIRSTYENETKFMSDLANKYGDGSLNLKNGTFHPAQNIS